MRTSSVGKLNNEGGSLKTQDTRAGVTLIEMLVVLVLIAIAAALIFPRMTGGIDSLRLDTAARSIASFINTGLSRAERRQEVVFVTIAKAERVLLMHSAEGDRKLQLPDGVVIENVLPETLSEEPDAARSIVLYPGGAVPAFGVTIANRMHSQRIVRVDPITGAPQIENPANK